MGERRTVRGNVQKATWQGSSDQKELRGKWKLRFMERERQKSQKPTNVQCVEELRLKNLIPPCGIIAVPRHPKSLSRAGKMRTGPPELKGYLSLVRGGEKCS